MKHCIIVKFRPEVTAAMKEDMLPAIKELFGCTTSLDGVNGVNVFTNCTPRDNRYDLMIEIDMTKEALPAYDDCEWHHRWKDEYGKYIDKKAIFDYE